MPFASFLYERWIRLTWNECVRCFSLSTVIVEYVSRASLAHCGRLLSLLPFSLHVPRVQTETLGPGSLERTGMAEMGGCRGDHLQVPVRCVTASSSDTNSSRESDEHTLVTTGGNACIIV